MSTESLAMSLRTEVVNAPDSKQAEVGPARRSQRIAAALTGGSIVVIVASLIAIVRVLPTQEALKLVQGTVGDLGPWGPLVFGIAYVAAGLLFVPGAALTLAAGALFGLLAGTLTVSVASTVTAACAFLIARYGARRKVADLAGRSPRFAAIDQAIGTGGWRIVAMLRLSPAVPFSLGNYLYGLTPIRFWPYVLASWVFMLPGTFLYVYIGHLGATGVAAAADQSSAVSVGRIALLVVGLAATVVVTAYVTRLARRALADRTEVLNARDRASTDDHRPQERQPVRLPRLLPLVAGLLAVVAIVARTQQGRLRGLFGPPQVTLQEAYQAKPDGPIVDHSVFDALLRKHVAPGGWVDYAGLAQSAAQLDAYLAAVKAAPLAKLGRNERLALLINAYNAFTLKLILEHWDGGRLASIKDIPADQRWDAVRWNVGGPVWSLNQIEQEQIRPKFREPRIHFALVCAAIGCPPLRAEAYTGARLEAQLSDQAEYMHTHDRWFRYEPGDTKIGLTKLYDWYGDDFKQVAGSVLEYVAQHATPLKESLDAGKRPEINWLDYDWRLNRKENER